MQGPSGHRAFFLLLLLTMPLASVGQTTRFEKVYGGWGKDRPFDVLQTQDGGYLVGGGSANYSADDGQAFLYRFDTIGDPLWDKGYGEGGTEAFRAIAYSADSSFIAAGISNSSPNGDYQFYLVKTDTSGDTIWTRRYGGSDWETLNALEVLPDSNYLLGGRSYSTDSGDADLFLMKVDRQGDSLWSRTYGGSGYDELNDIVRASNGDLILVGERTDSSGADTSRAYMIRTDSIGDPKWDSTYTYGIRSYFSSAIEKGNGDLVALVNHRDSVTDDPDPSLLRTGPNGTEIWSRFAGNTGNEVGRELLNTVDNGIIFAGHTNSTGFGKKDIWMLKTGNGGYFKWARTTGGPDDDRTYCIAQTSDSGFVTAGITTSYGNSPSNIQLSKTDSLGVSSGNVIVDLPGEAAKENGSAKNFQLYPNPIERGDPIHLRFPNSLEQDADLHIRDLQGRKMLERRLRTSKARTFTIGTSSLPPGFYLITIQGRSHKFVVR